MSKPSIAGGVTFGHISRVKAAMRQFVFNPSSFAITGNTI